MPSSESSTRHHILSLLKPELKTYSLGMLSLTILNVADAFAPVFMAVALDLTESSLTQAQSQTPPLLKFVGLEISSFTITSAIVIYLVLMIIANVLRYPMLMNTAIPSHRIGQTIRRKIADHLMNQSQKFYDGSKSGDLMNFATSDVSAIRMMLGPGLVISYDTVSLVLLVLTVMFGLSWQLTLVALIPLPLIIIFTNKLSHQEHESFKAVQEDIGDMTERVRESYAGIRLIQGYAREDFDRARFEDYSWRHYVKNLRLAKVKSLFDPTLDMFMGLSTTLVFTYGGWLVLNNQISLGTFVAFIFLIRYLAGPMIGFGWSVSLYQRGKASLNRLLELWDTPVLVKDEPGVTPSHDISGELTIKDLSFAYGAPQVIGNDNNNAPVTEEAQEPVLHNISLHLPAGKTLGIVGAVGSGKTTLARLLVRLYNAPKNTIFIDGKDIHDIPLESLRKHIILAPQDTFLFSDTVARNIALTADQQQVEEYTSLAALHDELLELPQGYDTMLGERGVNLSGGQRQRLAIARAIATNPDVLILDDCLSAVDARTEEAILNNLREVFDGRSGIIISHRVRAVQRCDEIIILEHGRIVEQGSHHELLNIPNGIYANLALEQTQHDREHTPGQTEQPPSSHANSAQPAE